MSAATARARTLAPAAAPAPARRSPLRLVPAGRDRARRAPFVAVVVALLAAGLLGLLVLNTALARDAFRLHELQVQGKALSEREQALLLEVEALQAPEALAERAAEMGMVPGGAPSFLRLPDGAVLGAGTPATAPTPAAAAQGPQAEQPADQSDPAPQSEQQSEQQTQQTDGGTD